MKQLIIAQLSKLTSLPENELSNLIEIPKDSKLGDFAFPCFILSKQMKKSPAQISQELASKINKEDFEKIEAVGPYLNFFLKKETLASSIINKILKEKNKYGSSNIGKGKRIIADFSAPNIGKPIHIGHIRSTILGDSIIKIHEFLGYNAIGINYLGDIGLHIGKLIVAYELWLDKKVIKENPVKELLRLYVKFCEHEKTSFEDENEDYEGNEWTKKAKEKLKLLEAKDKNTIKIWKEIIKYSLSELNKIYKFLNIKFTETAGQSNFSEEGKRIIVNAISKKLAFKDSSGAVYLELENLPKKYILRSNGTASYITQDIGAAVSRAKKYKFDKMIYVTDYRQQLHFQSLFEILKKFGFSFYKNCVHLPFGTINFGDEILATREGKIILLEEVISKAVEKAEEEIKKRNSKGNADKIAISAIKYAILKNEPIKDVSFSWEKALSFEGNTGPYLLYTYARANSILKKAKNKVKFNIPKLEEIEKQLILLLNSFPEIVLSSHEQLAPNLIANYAHSLARCFNEFYHSCHVLGSKEESFRLALVKASAQVLENSSALLGIEAIKRM